jgi:hypothetical protein
LVAANQQYGQGRAFPFNRVVPGRKALPAYDEWEWNVHLDNVSRPCSSRRRRQARQRAERCHQNPPHNTSLALDAPFSDVRIT